MERKTTLVVVVLLLTIHGNFLGFGRVLIEKDRMDGVDFLNHLDMEWLDLSS